MARTKQTPYKSIGGKAPRHQLARKWPGKNVPRVPIRKRLSPLHRAAANGNIRILTALLKSSAKGIEKEDQDGCTPLHYAARNGHLEAVKVLLANGASVDPGQSVTRPPLGYAAEEGHVEVVNALLAAGASLEARVPGYRTPLHYTAKNGHLEVAKALLTTEISITARDSWHETALDHAVKGRHWDVARLLLSEGYKRWATKEKDIDPNGESCSPPAVDDELLISVLQRDIEGDGLKPETPLEVTAHFGMQAMMLRLIREHGSCSNGLHYSHKSPLYFAIASGHQHCVSLLLTHGANAAPSGHGYQQTVQCALEHGHDEIAALLLHAGAKISDSTVAELLASRGAKVGATLLSHIQSLEDLTDSLISVSRHKHISLLEEYFDSISLESAASYANQRATSSTSMLVKWLMKNRQQAPNSQVDIREPGKLFVDGELRLRFAPAFILFSVSCPDVLHQMLTAVPDLRAIANSMLHSCVSDADTQLLARFSKVGYTLPPPRKWTPLYEASEAGDVKQVGKILEEGGIDINTQGLRDRTALHAAAQKGHTEVVRLLIQYGADLRAKTSFSSTAEHLALKYERSETAALLKEAKRAKGGEEAR